MRDLRVMTVTGPGAGILRRFLSIVPLLMLAVVWSRAAAAFEPQLGAAEPFSFDILVDKAKALAAKPYEEYKPPHPDLLDKIDYDAHWKIRFKPDSTIRLDDKIPLQFFHLGKYFRAPVRIALVENGEARQVVYREDYFTMPDDSPAKAIEKEAGFAGFRIMRPDMKTDWISYLGGAYFRTDGAQKQYGLSARGIAIDTGLSTPEEFPRFTEFYIAKGEGPDEDVVIYALLDGPSVTGAYRFQGRNSDGKGQVLTVSSRLFFRKPVERLGIAPLTSMYWYSETNRAETFDWRPEVHDSDGLAIITGTGEHIWRPLNNPARVVTSSFIDDNVRGFGLVQRDRLFDHYQDDSVFYEKRPSVWIEPIGDWGKGVVQLVEIPTDDEIYDNIVSYWLPEDLPKAGDERRFDYRMHWVSNEPFPGKQGHTVATYLGQGGVPGKPRPDDEVRVVVDFDGPMLKGVGRKDGVKPKITLSGAKVTRSYALPVVGTDRWRMIFDLKMPKKTETIDIRAFLDKDGKPLTETWLGQLHASEIAKMRPR